MKHGLLVIGLLIVIVGTGCATVKGVPTVGVSQNLDAQRADYTVMNTVEGTGKAVRIFGIGFPWGASLATVGYSSVSLPGDAAKAKGMAMFDALGKVPDADTMIPMTVTLEKNGIPILFRTCTATVKGKAIKIKTDSEIGKK